MDQAQESAENAISKTSFLGEGSLVALAASDETASIRLELLDKEEQAIADQKVEVEKVLSDFKESEPSKSISGFLDSIQQ